MIFLLVLYLMNEEVIFENMLECLLMEVVELLVVCFLFYWEFFNSFVFICFYGDIEENEDIVKKMVMLKLDVVMVDGINYVWFYFLEKFLLLGLWYIFLLVC